MRRLRTSLALLACGVPTSAKLDLHAPVSAEHLVVHGWAGESATLNHDTAMKRLIEPLLMPPLGPLVLLVAGFCLLSRCPRAGRALLGTGLAALVLLSQPFVAATLLIGLQIDAPLPPSGPLPKAGAIVILGGDLDPGTPEFGGPSAGALSLQRVRYGAQLAHRTGLPVLVTGGPPEAGRDTIARLMAKALAELGVEARWIEGRAGDTRENARFSADLLGAEGVDRVLLVSHAWHLARARGAFEAAGLEVVGAPTAPRTWPDARRIDAYLPSTKSLHESRWGLHEWIGRAWYSLTR